MNRAVAYRSCVALGFATVGCGDGYLDSLYLVPDESISMLPEAGLPGPPEPDAMTNTPEASPDSADVVLPMPGLLIDDMEDGDTFIAEVDGRHGAWYYFNDGSAGNQWPVPLDMTPVLDRQGVSSYALRFGGSGFSGWGSGVATPLALGAGTFYDATRFSGISFWARVEESSPRQAFRVNFPNAQTTPEGGECGIDVCYDYFGTDITLTTAWRQYFVYFKDIQQTGWGYPYQTQPFDASRLQEISFFPGPAHEIWIDDIAFLAP